MLLPVLFTSCGLFSKISGEDEEGGGVEKVQKQPSLSQQDSMQIKAILIEAKKEEMIGNKQKALETFKKAFKVDSTLPSVHYELARILRDKKERSEALKHAKKACSLAPENDWYQKFLAELYIEYGSYKEAAGVYNKLREEKEGDRRLAYRHARALIRAGEHKKAIGIYDSIEAKVGLQARVTLQKQRLYQRMGKAEKALKEVKELVRKFPDRARYYGIMAEIYQKMGERKKALESYERLLQKDPKNGKAHLSMSRFYRKEGKSQKALEHLKKAYQSKDIGIDRKMKVLLRYFKRSQGRPELKKEAYELLDVLLKVHPQEAKAYTVYGDFLSRDGKKKKARRMFKKAVSLDAGRFPIWRQIMVLDQKMGNMDSLLLDSREAKEYFPNQPMVYMFESIALLRQERYKEAIDPLKYGKSLVVDNDELKYRFLKRLGEAHYRVEQLKASDRAFEKALDIRPDDAFLLNNYAYYLSTRGDSLDKAMDLSKRANSINPGRPSFLDTYGWILYQKEKYQQAKKKLKKALDNGGRSSATILEHYGDVLYRTGSKDKALQYWKKARDAGGGSEELDKKIREEELPTP
ncbi:MAG: tetratricopeptide repeat protein [Flavobacteriales bacterium]